MPKVAALRTVDGMKDSFPLQCDEKDNNNRAVQYLFYVLPSACYLWVTELLQECYSVF